MTETSIFWKVIESVSDQGRRLIRLGDAGNVRNAPIEVLSRALVSEKGEASGVAVADLFIERYRSLDEDAKLEFFALLRDEFGPDTARLDAALASYRADEESPRGQSDLHYATEPLRQELLRRINAAPGGIAALVGMRADLLDALREHPDLSVVDDDFEHLFRSWFNRGFLVLTRIDWQTPAAILEKIIEYEAVHAIDGWEDLRRRVDAPDRRLYAFFHPALIDIPLIFVEVALTRDNPDSIQEILAEDRKPVPVEEVSTAVFYSISNCQRGLRGVAFGSFLIKQVVDDLRQELDRLNSFVTLSPIPGLRQWLTDQADADDGLFGDQEKAVVSEPALQDLPGLEDADAEVRKSLLALAAHYLVQGKARDGRPADPVARFHLGNGARLDRLNWLADTSVTGLARSFGIMVNYRYVIDEIEANHEAFANQGTIAASSSVRRLLRVQRTVDRTKSRSETTEPSLT
ncbi:MAG: malonyl-CoA decarboxylase [Pseudomonadota bacterium]